MDLPKAVDNLIRGHGGNGQARRWVMRLLLVGVLAAVGWDLADAYIDGDVRSLFYRLIYWAFIGLVGLLLWSSLKVLEDWRLRLGLVGLVVLGVVLALNGTASEFPTGSTFSPDKWVDDAMGWMVEHWRGFFRGGLTVSLLKVLVPLEQRLLNVPWWLFIGVMTLLAWRVGRQRLALTTLASLLFLVFVGLWDQAMRTVAVVGTATVVSVFLAIPMGITMAKNRWFEAIMRPVLDTMQTMPSFVYLIPAIFFLGLGKVPAVLATMVYAIPPAMRLTSLGIQLVSPELKEAARAFGTTPWQMLVKVELPLARPTIMAGVNQTIMMALAMVVIASMVGAKGLGADVLLGIAQLETGTGLMGGLGIVALAIVFDRISQGFAKDPNESGP